MQLKENERIKVLLIIRTALFRESLVTAMNTTGFINVVESAGTLKEALEKIRATHPDIILLELYMKAVPGIEILKKIMIRNSKEKVIVLSKDPPSIEVHNCLEAGASGYITSNSVTAEVNSTIIEVYKDKEAARKKATIRLRLSLLKKRNPGADSLFTAKQKEILALLELNFSNEQIAAELNMSPHTVATHLKEMFRRTGTHNREDLRDFGLDED